ncbi:unnamed protein product, partial [Allacma fusca]
AGYPQTSYCFLFKTSCRNPTSEYGRNGNSGEGHTKTYL